MATTTSNTIDPVLFRRTVGSYASGITITTGHDDLGPVGFTCQSFYSVSVDPPLVSFSVMKTSRTYQRIRETGTFAVNILSRGQETVSDQFARSGTDKWANVPWEWTEQGNPVLDGTLAWLDCRIWAEHDAGDQLIVAGQVVELGTTHEHRPDPPSCTSKGSTEHSVLTESCELLVARKDTHTAQQQHHYPSPQARYFALTKRRQLRGSDTNFVNGDGLSLHVVFTYQDKAQVKRVHRADGTSQVAVRTRVNGASP